MRCPAILCWLERENLHGMAARFKQQTIEEHGYAMKIMNLMNVWDVPITPQSPPNPAIEFDDLKE